MYIYIYIYIERERERGWVEGCPGGLALPAGEVWPRGDISRKGRATALTVSREDRATECTEQRLPCAGEGSLVVSCATALSCEKETRLLRAGVSCA